MKPTSQAVESVSGVKYISPFAFRLNEGNVKQHTLARLDSLVDATVGKRLTYAGLIQ